MQAAVPKPSLANRILWTVIAITGARCLGVVALRRGEPINAIWLVAALIFHLRDRLPPLRQG